MEPFMLELRGTGCFAQGEFPKVLWIGVEKSEPLHRLKEKVDRVLEKYKLPFENRKYIPHVTLARLRRDASPLDVADYLATRGHFPKLSFTADRFVLFSSRDSVGGGPYVVEAAYPLG